MRLDGRQMLLSLSLILLVNCWLCSAFHVQYEKVGKRTQKNVQMKNQFRELCQTAQQQCLDINADVTEGINEKREQKREKITVNPVDKKEDSIDLLSSLRSLCHIVELQCDSILDNRVSLEHKSLRSLWQRD